MKQLFIAFLCLLLSACQQSPSRPDSDDRLVQVVLETSLGNIVLKVDTVNAPVTSTYFLNIVDRGLYNGATFYRSASLDGGQTPQLIQGGILVNALTQTGPISATDFDMPTLPEVESTSQTGLKHLRGTLSFARDLLDTGVVIPELVVYLREAPWADEGGRSVPDTQGFPAFGRVSTGLDVVENIANQKTNGGTSIKFLQGQIHTTPIVIRKAYRAPN